MAENFELKIKLVANDKNVLPLLNGLLEALEESDHAAFREIVSGTPFATHVCASHEQNLSAFIEDSEYKHLDGPIIDTLMDAIVDAEPYLYITGSKKLAIHFAGTDNGTADACSLFLLMLNSLGVSDLSASGKGFTWKTTWEVIDGRVKISKHQRLVEGQNAKVDEQQQKEYDKQQQAANKDFLASPFSYLAKQILETHQCDVSLCIATCNADSLLGITYKKLFAEVKKLPSQSGLTYHDEKLSIECHNTKEIRTVTISWENQKASPEHLSKLIDDSNIALTFDPRKSDSIFSDFEWVANGVGVALEITSEGNFVKLKLTDVPWLKGMSTAQRFDIIFDGYQCPFHVGAHLWSQLFAELKEEAEAGNVESMLNLGMICNINKCGCPPQNWREAQKWWEKAAELGNTSAMNALGRHYAEGWGDWPKNAKKAEHYFRMGAELKNSRCIEDLDKFLQKKAM